MEKYEAHLKVNNNQLELNPFVEQYLSKVSHGIITSLKGIEYVRDIQITDKNGDIFILVNGEEVSITPFPIKIISSTLRGLVSALKDVNQVGNLDVIVKISK